MSADSGREKDTISPGDNVVPIREREVVMRERTPLEPVEYGDIVTVAELPTTG